MPTLFSAPDSHCPAPKAPKCISKMVLKLSRRAKVGCGGADGVPLRPEKQQSGDSRLLVRCAFRSACQCSRQLLQVDQPPSRCSQQAAWHHNSSLEQGRGRCMRLGPAPGQRTHVHSVVPCWAS